MTSRHFVKTGKSQPCQIAFDMWSGLQFAMLRVLVRKGRFPLQAYRNVSKQILKFRI